MWLKKSVVIIDDILKILDITRLRYIYIYIYIGMCIYIYIYIYVCMYVYKERFGFKLGAFNPNISFPIM